MSYRFVEHTAELGLEIDAASFEQLLVQATRAFAELVSASESGPPARHSVELESGEERTLVADWLNELVYLADVHSFVPERVGRLERTESGVRAELVGHQGAPRPLVKAVTYSELELRSGPGGWHARVVLDV